MGVVEAARPNCVSRYFAMKAKKAIIDESIAHAPRIRDMKVKLVTSRRMAFRNPDGHGK